MSALFAAVFTRLRGFTATENVKISYDYNWPRQ